MNLHYLTIGLACVISIVTIASAATAFDEITIVGPFMKSCWRLQITTFCYLIAIAATWKSNKDDYILILKEEWRRITLAGVFLGAHFCLWTVSLALTSVAHSLLFLCSTPLLIVVYSVIAKKDIKNIQIYSVIVGFIGMVTITLGTSENHEGATWYGDLIAFLGSVMIWLNYILSEKLMETKSLLSLCVMHGAAAFFCFFGAAFEDVAKNGITSVQEIQYAAGYLYNKQGIYGVYLGIVVGFMGNGCLYYILKYTNPLVTSTIINFEPLVGTIFAWIFGFQSAPSLLTWIGGTLIFTSNLVVTVSSKLKNPDEKLKTKV